MPNIVNQKLVRAFNIILCHNEVAITNFTVQNTDQTFFKKEDRIVISFDKNMDVGQCMEYLHNIRERIVETFCGSESGANMSFNTKFFPFNFNESQLTKDKEGYKFSVPIDKDIVLNLKCLLANGLTRDVTGAMGRDFGLEYVEKYTSDESFDRKSYLYCMRFYNERLQNCFVELFSSKVKDYKNSPKKTGDFLKIKDNHVYIKASIFDDVKFIEDIIKHKASLECRDFEIPSSEDENVENLKFLIIALLRGMGIPADTILHTSYTGSGENSVLVPIIQMTPGIVGKENCRLLDKKEVNYVNGVFGMDVLRNVQDYTLPKHLPVFGNGGVYGIDFYDKDISYCVLNKIVESSVINKRHELAIDPEFVRALSPVQSPVRAPNEYLNEARSTKCESPTRSQDGALKRSPRQGSLYYPVNPDGTSKGFSPSPRLSSTAVSYGVSGPSSLSQSVSAAQNVQAGTSAWSQQTNPYLSQGTFRNKWQPLPLTEPGLSGLSWNSAAWTQSRSSSNERPDSIHSADSGYSGSLERPQPNSSITTSAVPGISKSGKGSNVAAVPVDNKRPQSLPLTENTPKPSNESPGEKFQQFFKKLSIRRLSRSNGKAIKDILQFDRETFSSFSSGMRNVLSLSLSLDMIRSLFSHFPIEKCEKLILLACSEKVKKSHSSPEEIEQLLSSLPPEEQEICSLLFFPDRKNKTHVDPSPGAKEQVDLLLETIRGQGFNSTSSEESGIFSGSSSQGSISSELKHPQRVKHMSEALGK